MKHPKLRPDKILEPAGNVGLPRRVIVFHSTPKTLRHDQVAQVEYRTMGLLQLIYWERKGQKYVGTAASSFTNRRDFWHFLYARCKDDEPITLICYGLYEQLTWLDVWLEMEEGRLRLADPCNPHGYALPGYGTNGTPWKGIIIDDDPPSLLIVRHGKCTLRFVDCRNWWNVSLSTIVEWSANLANKVDAMFDGDEHSLRENVRTMAGLSSAILAHLEMVDRSDIGGFRMTAAAQAWAAYRRRFMEMPIYLHGDLETLKLERESYYGGLIRSLFVGKVKGPVYILDIQSFYPALMGALPYPYAADCEGIDPCLTTLTTIPAGHSFAARVDIESHRECYPVRMDGQTLYAKGKFTTSLVGADLARAAVNNDIAKIHFLITYKTGILFRNYVEWVWIARRTAEDKKNPVGVDLAKQLGRSLYGKFGQLSAYWIDRPGQRTARAWGRWSEGWGTDNEGKSYRALAGHVQEQVSKRWYEVNFTLDLLDQPRFEHPVRTETEGSFPAISGSITAAGRNAIMALAAIAGAGHCFYIGVDSLHVDQFGYDRLTVYGYIQPGVLGKFRVKHRAETVEYIGDNHYIVDGVPVCAGMTVSKVNEERGTYTVMEAERVGTILNTGPGGVTKTRKLEKAQPGVTVQGTIGKGGWVDPPQLS